MTRPWPVIALLAVLASAASAEPSRWTASAPTAPGGIQLTRTHPDDWKTVRTGGGVYAALKPSADYYTSTSFRATLPRPAPDGSWLTVTYLDRGYGLIQVGGAYSEPVKASGVLRLNTGKPRRAVMQLTPGATTLQISGAPLLGALEVTAAEPAREPTPAHEPAFRLANPPNLVMGALGATGDPAAIAGEVAYLHAILPLVRAIGFNAVESYIRWDFVERTPGTFDWSTYDAILAECERNGLKWFPLIVIGSAYSLPDWFQQSADFVGYRCLEHGTTIEIPTIFHDGQTKYVKRFLAEFGKHYASRDGLMGFRLGPSANYGEAQYPATGELGYKGRPLHTHIGYWAGDPWASVRFREWLQARYPTIADLNRAWDRTTYGSFADVVTFLPATARNNRMRKDFATWYTDAMTDWCEKWAEWAREAVPNKPIYQSSGAWGLVEVGTDYTAHTKTMARLHGGIRMTNENDSYQNNFCVTRPAATAARTYGALFGTEPAGFSCQRGVMNRLYNILTNNGQHLFYYASNILEANGAIDAWVKHAPLLDQRAQPITEVAAFYPDTANKATDAIMRHLHASQLFIGAKQMRSVTDYDLVGEQLVLDGALAKYRVLVFLAGRVTEQPVLDAIDRWIRGGGVAIYPVREASFAVPLANVEGSAATWNRWRRGETGKGRVIFYDSHPEPVLYTRFLRRTLGTLDVLSPGLRAAINMTKPEDVYWARLTNGKICLLNYGDDPASIRLPGGAALRLAPYSIEMR